MKSRCSSAPRSRPKRLSGTHLRMHALETLKRKWQTTSSSASLVPERSIPGWFSTPVPTLESSTTSQETRN